jgi:glycosyltransferase involved in cell wall biosynthesis
MTKTRIAVLMSCAFYPNTHCALSTWTHEVYRRNLEHLETTVVAPSSRPLDGFYYDVLSVPSAIKWDWLTQKLRRRNLLGLAPPIKTFAARRARKFLSKAAAQTGARILHVHNDPELGIACRKAAPQARIILHMNNDFMSDRPLEVAKAAANAVDWMAFCSNVMLLNALDRLPEEVASRSFVIPNGTNVPERSTLPTHKKDQPEIIFAGRMIQEKGPHILLSAMQEVLSRHPDVRLSLIGPLSERTPQEAQFSAQLKRLAEPLGTAVNFTGALSHDETQARIRAADIFVCPSLWLEPFGMVNVEAMAAEVTVVAFANGGIPEVVGAAGVLLEDESPQALANTLSDLIENPDRREALGAAGRKRVETKFTWDLIAEEWQTRLTDTLRMVREESRGKKQ